MNKEISNKERVIRTGIAIGFGLTALGGAGCITKDGKIVKGVGLILESPTAKPVDTATPVPTASKPVENGKTVTLEEVAAIVALLNKPTVTGSERYTVTLSNNNTVNAAANSSANASSASESAVKPVEQKAEPKAEPKVEPTVAVSKVEASKTIDTSSFNELLPLIPGFPVLVKEDPQTKFVPNRVPMWFAAGDEANPLNALRSKVNAFSNSKGWGDITAKPGEWFYPLPIKNGNGETGSDTWAYAENIIESRNLSIYEKPGVTGQTWFRLPKGVVRGDMVAAFAVNQNFEADKTGGDPNIAPAVIVRCSNNPGQSVEVRVLDAYKDGRVFARNVGHIGLPETDTDNIMVRLNREAITIIYFPVVDQTGNQREGVIELGSDAWKGSFYNPNLNRITVEDVAMQLK